MNVRVSRWWLAALLPAVGGVASAIAAEPPAVDVKELAGSTLSAVAYVPKPAGAPGGGELQRMMLQAYLAPDGGAMVRKWLPERNRYSSPAPTHWSLSANRLCIDMPAVSGNAGADAPLCAVVHVWWPRISGIGTQPYAMLDGDLQRGNAIGGRTAR